MARNKFKLEDGFYRIKENQKPDLKKFFIEQMKGNPRTSKGNLSKAGINTKTIIIDGPNGQYEAFFKGDGDKWKFNQQAVQNKSANRRALQIKKNRPTLEVFEEAGRLWDELVGKKGKFTMGDRTFNSKKEYQEFEANRHDTITKNKEKLNRIGGRTHGHAVPPKHQYAVETYMQSFPEDASPNYSSQDKVPKDFKKRLTKADIPTTKTEVAKRHVGTSDRITNPIPDSIKEKLLKFFKSNGNGNNNGNGVKINGGKTQSSALALERANPTLGLIQQGANLAQLGMRNLSLLNMISEALTKKQFTSHVGDTVKRGANNLMLSINNPEQRAKDIAEQQKKLKAKKDLFKIAKKKYKKATDKVKISTL
tara:strand:- start:45 stop:1142 length:1098 start_codon:yes stop_codon:yes gene_type:complete